MKAHRHRAAAILVLAIPLVATGATAGTTVKPYAVPEGSHYLVTPLFSVGDRVAETSDPGLQYQMIGIPDGLGAHPSKHKTTILYMNHELRFDLPSEPIVGGPLNRGSFVSKLVLDQSGNVLSGERAYDSVFIEDTLVGPAAEMENSTPGFGRFCSAFLGTFKDGFDRRIFFTNEEADPPRTFDPKGASTVAVFDNEAHVLPRLGHFAKENSIAMPARGTRTVILSLEDGPNTPDSQLYMYVGKKVHRRGASDLSRNGLNNGILYVFASDDPSRNNELTFQTGTVEGHWAEIPNAQDLTDIETEAVADAAGAFGFVRMEDGAFSKKSRKDFYFVTTGGNEAAGNALGRLYHLKLNRGNPLRGAEVSVVLNADEVAAAGGDIAVSPDNIDTSKRHLMVQEGGTMPARDFINAQGREYGIWRFNLTRDALGVDPASATRVVELNPPGRDGIVPMRLGPWESSGIIDASRMFGADSWLFDVQAHPPTTPPFPNTVEDGQLLLMKPHPEV
jgi:serralysin